MIYAPINETLPATGGTVAVISLPATTSANDFAIQARGSVDMLISNVLAMTTYFTIKSGTAISLSQVLGPGQDIVYVISGSDADVVEILPMVK